MGYSIDVQLAETLAIELHQGQIDKAGEAYINHPRRVASMLSTPELKVIAWMHDAIEDTNYTQEEAIIEFGVETALALDAISRKKNETWNDYINRVATNPFARRVKICDLIDNSNLSRLKTISLKDIERQQKYNNALKYLFSVEGKDNVCIAQC